VRTVLQKDGVRGLYAGWFAALAQKIPSYGLTWVFFQQLKQTRCVCGVGRVCLCVCVVFRVYVCVWIWAQSRESKGCPSLVA
jgi:hypothetical protein